MIYCTGTRLVHFRLAGLIIPLTCQHFPVGTIPYHKRKGTKQKLIIMATMGGRIPLSLQKIFMASNQGEEVYVPPSDNTAFKVYGLNACDSKKSILFNYASSEGFKKSFASVSFFRIRCLFVLSILSYDMITLSHILYSFLLVSFDRFLLKPNST